MYTSRSKCSTECNNEKSNVIKERMKIISLLSLITIILTSCIQYALLTSEDEQKVGSKHGDPATEIIFSHHVVLDKEGNYHLYWIPEENIITFEVQVSFFAFYLWLL